MSPNCCRPCPRNIERRHLPGRGADTEDLKAVARCDGRAIEVRLETAPESLPFSLLDITEVCIVVAESAVSCLV